MFISAMNNIKPGVIHSILVGYQWKEFLLPNSVQFSSVPQLCPTLCDPIDGTPPGSPVPRILQARTLELVSKYTLFMAKHYS